ncbi:hypothetical protein ISR92_01070 [Patescibacteria group bacterium]|nr:hypothetical protein [Patescibacteria group bacterium]
MSEKDYRLVKLGEDSPLKSELNNGIASLQAAEKSCFQPHLCLNDKEGLEVIRQITANPNSANTEIWIREQIVYGGGKDIWLNVNFSVFIDQICWPTNIVNLTPRQTGYIVRQLSPEMQKVVIQKVKEWYLEKLLPDYMKSFERVTEQFETGDPLLESHNGNRIFDIHGERRMDIEYTEGAIIGNLLFYPVFMGHTLFHHGQDGYAAADEFLSSLDSERALAIDTTLSILRQ